MQYGDEDETCIVHQAEYPPQRNCKSVVEALVMANNVDEEVWDPIIWEVIVGFTFASRAAQWTPISGRHGASSVYHPRTPPSSRRLQGNRFCS